jgi:predicted O-methyltransferase YrrM
MNRYDHRVDIPGFTFLSELNILSNIASMVPEHGSILEIGPCYGRSTHALYIGKPKNVSLTTIDKWGPPIDFKLHTYEGNPNLLSIVQSMSDAREGFEYCLGKDIINNITVIQDNSKNIKITENNSYNLVFIDGDHSYETVKMDLCKHKKDTLVILDDFSENHIGTIQAATEFKRSRIILAGGVGNTKIALLIPTTGYWSNYITQIMDIFVKAQF